MQAHNETSVARYAYLPSLGVDFFYGINANQLAADSGTTQATGRSTLPNYLVSQRHNLGYSAAITLNIPIWDWGTIRSRVKQAELREQQTRFDLAVAQRQVRADIRSAYLEATVAQQQLASLRDSTELSRESLRLTVLRYKAGEATVLEVVDAQSTAAAARNAYADGLSRYRLAIATVQALTGHF
jgi:outer membrane protein TolC